MLKYPKKGDIIMTVFDGKIYSRNVKVLDVAPRGMRLLFSDGSNGWHNLHQRNWDYHYQLEFNFNPRAN